MHSDKVVDFLLVNGDDNFNIGASLFNNTLRFGEKIMTLGSFLSKFTQAVATHLGTITCYIGSPNLIIRIGPWVIEYKLLDVDLKAYLVEMEVKREGLPSAIKSCQAIKIDKSRGIILLEDNNEIHFHDEIAKSNKYVINHFCIETPTEDSSRFIRTYLTNFDFLLEFKLEEILIHEPT